MQVVILAAGSSSRFYPFNVIHKSCLRLLGKTILEHTLESVKRSGITEVILVVNNDGEIKKIVGDGKKFGLSLTYIVQDNPTGAGDALLLAKKYITEDFLLTWGTRVEFDTFLNEMIAAKKDDGGVVLVKETENLSGIGVVKHNGDQLVDVIEKPDIKNPPSKLKIIGMYVLPQKFLETLTTISSEHYSFEKALSTFAKDNNVRVVTTTKEALTLKYPWDILNFKNYLLSRVHAYKGKNITIGKNAVIEGNVYIDDGVKIKENAVIKGPCYIGKNAFIGNNALLRGGSVIEENVVIGTNMEVKNSVLLSGTSTHSGFIGDSVIGQNCKIAANITTGNVRLDRESVIVTINNEQIQSHKKALGVFMGDNVKLGISVSTMPGIIIGRNVVIGPQTTVMKNISDDTKYYTKFSETFEKVSARGGSSLGRKKRFILFDIDNTLYDTSSLRKKLFETIFSVFDKHDVGEAKEVAEEIYHDLVKRTGIFYPEDLVTELKNAFPEKNIPEKALLDAMYDDALLTPHVYEEVKDLIQEFKNMGELGIFSQGMDQFQKLKIKHIADHFQPHHTHIVTSKLKNLDRVFRKYKEYEVFFLDDALPILAEAKKRYPNIFVIWVKRGRHAAVQEPIPGFTPDATVLTLKEAERILKEN